MLVYVCLCMFVSVRVCVFMFVCVCLCVYESTGIAFSSKYFSGETTLGKPDGSADESYIDIRGLR